MPIVEQMGGVSSLAVASSETTRLSPDSMLVSGRMVSIAAHLQEVILDDDAIASLQGIGI